MDAVFKKLNYKGQEEVVILNSPESFEANIQSLGTITIQRSIGKLGEMEFVMCFVQKQSEIEDLVPQLVGKLKGDVVLWFCYPKGTSKRYRSDFNRDTGWTILGKLGWEPVRMVAIDEDWSALRFRNVQFIKNITRRESFALTEEAKRRTTNKKD